MKLARFPIPYPGELFFGTLCRLFHELDRPAVGAFCKAVTGIATNPGTTIASHLADVERNLPAGYPLNADGIRRNHTLEPFLLGFLNWARKQKCAVEPTLKSCPECRRADRDMVGEAYWHRIHQVPGIHYCIHHQCLLEIAERDSLFTGKGRGYRPDFFLPDDVGYLEIQNPGKGETHLGLLGMIQDILAGKNIPWEDEQASLWGEMERQEFTRGRWVQGWKVLTAGQEKFGDELATLFEIPEGERGRRIITNILTGAEMRPMRILFLHLLLNLPVSERAAPADRIAIDYREKKKGRNRVSPEQHALRNKFLRIAKGKLPSDLRDTKTFQKLEETDGDWLRRTQEIRINQRQKARSQTLADDAQAAELVEKIAEKIRNLPGSPVWIKKTKILREASEHRALITRCQHAPLTKAAFEKACHTKEDIINLRVEWAKANSPDGKIIAAYEFRCLAGIRGIKDAPTLPGLISRQGVQAMRAEQAAAMAANLDPEASAAVKRAVGRLLARPGRPEWVRLPSIIREAGTEGEMIATCKNQPLTRAELAKAIDTHASVLEKRIAWAKREKPEILKMADYDQKCALGLRGWKVP